MSCDSSEHRSGFLAAAVTPGSGRVVVSEIRGTEYLSENLVRSGWAVKQSDNATEPQVTLGLFTAAVPTFLLFTARRSVAARDVSLHLRYKNMSQWFDELDRDGAREESTSTLVSHLPYSPAYNPP